MTVCCVTCDGTLLFVTCDSVGGLLLPVQRLGGGDETADGVHGELVAGDPPGDPVRQLAVVTCTGTQSGHHRDCLTKTDRERGKERRKGKE